MTLNARCRPACRAYAGAPMMQAISWQAGTTAVAADEKRYTLTNSEDTIRLKNLLFFRVKAEMDAYHDMSRAPESNTPEEIERQRARFCSVWQVLEEAELVDEYDAWKCAGGGAK